MSRPRNRIWVGVVVFVAVASGLIWWKSGDDVRRVNAACDAWLQDRDMLRHALLETDEAIGRAEAEHATRIGPYYNDRDETLGQLTTWYTRGGDATKNLTKDSESSLERAAEFSLAESASGIATLVSYVKSQEPHVVADWLTEVFARFQSMDDVCLAAARRS